MKSTSTLELILNSNQSQAPIWLETATDAYASMLECIGKAQSVVQMSTYHFAGDAVGIRFRDALARACRRGVRVQLLIDAAGSIQTPNHFFDPILESGGEVRTFNPGWRQIQGPRNHQKLLVLDQRIAFIGGFNIGAEYEGDGVKSGWRDYGLRLEGYLAHGLSQTFRHMLGTADLHRKSIRQLRAWARERRQRSGIQQILINGPGWGMRHIKQRFIHDLNQAREIYSQDLNRCASFDNLVADSRLGWWRHQLERFCYYLLVRLDPRMALSADPKKKTPAGYPKGN